jgi:hypothetical protein
MPERHDKDDGWVPGKPLASDPSALPGAGRAGSGDEPAAPLYGSLGEWVEEHLAPLIRRRFGGALTWCPFWFRHAEAVSRLNALWQEWEHARVEHTLSMWWITHADPHLRVLMSKDDGPFMACKPAEGSQQARHVELEPLPVSTSEPALWLSSAFSDPDHAHALAPDAAPGGTPPLSRD